MKIHSHQRGKPFPVSTDEKLQKALEFLGERWVLHPKYQFIPKHSQLGYDSGKYKAAQS